jgi:hypothetical protein
MTRRGRVPLAALITAVVLGLSSCGSTSSSTGSANGSTPAVTAQSQTSFAKTKFLLHAGLAFGAFHHFIYKPLKSGGLTGGGLFGHKLALVKAGLAGLFAYHEVKLALTDAQSSPLLRRLVSPLTGLVGLLQSLGTRLKGGKVDPSAIEATNTQVTATDTVSRAAGQVISEATPSAAQLASG